MHRFISFFTVLTAAALLSACGSITYFWQTFGLDLTVRGYEDDNAPTELIAERVQDANPFNTTVTVTESEDLSYKTIAWHNEFLIYPSAVYFNMARNINALLRESCEASGGRYRPSGPWDKSASEHVCFLKGSNTVLFDWNNAITGREGDMLTYTTTLTIAQRDALHSPQLLKYSAENFAGWEDLPAARAAYESHGVKVREAVRAVYDQRMRPQGLSAEEKKHLSLFERQWFSYIMLSERARGMQVCSLTSRDTLTYRLGYIVNSASERIQVYVSGSGYPLEGFDLPEFVPYYTWERPEKWQADCVSMHQAASKLSHEGMRKVIAAPVNSSSAAVEEEEEEEEWEPDEEEPDEDEWERDEHEPDEDEWEPDEDEPDEDEEDEWE